MLFVDVVDFTRTCMERSCAEVPDYNSESIIISMNLSPFLS